MEALRGAEQVVGRRDHRLAGTRLGLQDVHEVLLGHGVDAGDGLVQQVQVGLGGDRPRQEDAPALAAGQGPDLAIRLRLPCRPSRAPRRRAPGRSRPGRRPNPMQRVAAHHHHVADRDRELPVDGLGLGQVRDPLRRLAPAAPPSTTTRPEHGWSSPAMTLISVLLPAPLGPTTASSEPGATVRVTWDSATRSP